MSELSKNSGHNVKTLNSFRFEIKAFELELEYFQSKIKFFIILAVLPQSL